MREALCGPARTMMATSSLTPLLKVGRVVWLSHSHTLYQVVELYICTCACAYNVRTMYIVDDYDM